MITFDGMGLRPEILRAIGELGFETPTPIQEKVIPLLIEGSRDITGLAQTGSGKTAAFGLPVLHRIDPGSTTTQALVLCPTRELCIQIVNDLTRFAKFCTGVKILAVYGGSSIEAQIHSLRRGVQIVVATPGRLGDLMRRRKIDISKVDTVILDEADEMLNMGFRDEINTILAETPEEKRTLLFSATMPKEVAAIASGYMNDPIEVTVGRKNAGNENVRHVYYMVHTSDRYRALKRIVDASPEVYGIVFCRTRQETGEIAGRLAEDGYSAEALHGDLTQPQRDAVMGRFRAKVLRLLVATDVAARGLDVNELTHVINYNLPDDIDVYTHRSGRTGRAGKTGVSVSIIPPRDRYRIERLEKMLHRPFEKGKIPDGKDICRIRLSHLVDRIEQTTGIDDEIAAFIPEIAERLSSLSREELIVRFVAAEFKSFLEYYKNEPDIEPADRQAAKSPRHERTAGIVDYAKFQINVGGDNGMRPQVLMSLINRHTRNRSIGIGRTRIMDDCSYFEADRRYANDILDAFRKATFENRKLVVSLSDEQSGKRGSDRSGIEKTGRKPSRGVKTTQRK
jgi:ATP-dependent RNA helicase DeaD